MSEPTMPGIDLRGLLQQRTEHKLRRVHKQWFCLAPQIQADLDTAEKHLAELIGAEVRKQQLHQDTSRKYSMPSPIKRAEARYTELKEQSRQSGVMGVFQNLNDDQIEQVKQADGSFEKAKLVLTLAWLRWEDADGNTIPADQLGRDDLDMLLQPEVLEQGEWLPLATTIVNDSVSVVDRPTSPA